MGRAMSRAVKFIVASLLLVLVGCTVRPPTSIHQPMTAKPAEKQTLVPSDGAIFHAGVNERPLFEDKRARNVGDLLTINIVEKTSGNRKGGSGSSFSSSTNANIPAVNTNIPDVLMRGSIARLFKQLFSLSGSATGSTSNKAADASSGSASEDLTGTITVTVIEVYPNGNLLVSGEKQVALNQSDEFIRFSGVVNPTTITGTNTVPSTQVADAHIEYKNAGALNEVLNDMQTMGFLGRFFKSVMPF